MQTDRVSAYRALPMVQIYRSAGLSGVLKSCLLTRWKGSPVEPWCPLPALVHALVPQAVSQGALAASCALH
eukprot:9860466-Lingulodinium_polyedra.AAC.1